VVRGRIWRRTAAHDGRRDRRPLRPQRRVRCPPRRLCLHRHVRTGRAASGDGRGRRPIGRPGRWQSHDREGIVMLAALLALMAQSQFTVTNAVYNGLVKRPANVRLVWRDEFNGRKLDPGRWENDTTFNRRGWFNKEKQYYSAGQNLRVAGGRLVME